MQASKKIVPEQSASAKKIIQSRTEHLVNKMLDGIEADLQHNNLLRVKAARLAVLQVYGLIKSKPIPVPALNLKPDQDSAIDDSRVPSPKPPRPNLVELPSPEETMRAMTGRSQVSLTGKPDDAEG